ncbi:MAG: hypothetical protein JO371_09945 [Paraburkholderia sp.]|nr:hypothetical protein [Paraburkholderia sp.]
MEKWLVVCGIWTMCALCAVLFIRGATYSATREMKPARINARSERSSKGAS